MTDLPEPVITFHLYLKCIVPASDTFIIFSALVTAELDVVDALEPANVASTQV